MANTDPLPLNVLEAVAGKAAAHLRPLISIGTVPSLAGPLSAPVGGANGGNPLAAPQPPLARLHETFRMCVLDRSAPDFPREVEAAGYIETLQPYLENTGRWHHQVHIGHPSSDSSGVPVAYLRSKEVEGEPEAFHEVVQAAVSPLAGRIDGGITVIDAEQASGRLPPETRVRLLHISSKFLYAFHLWDERSGYECLLVLVQHRGAAGALQMGTFLTPGQFLAGLINGEQNASSNTSAPYASSNTSAAPLPSARAPEAPKPPKRPNRLLGA